MSDYLDLINNYWSNIKEYKLNPFESNLYLYLLNIWNENENSDFEKSDVEISIELKMTRKRIKSSRENLRNIGLISFQNRKGLPTFYKIIIDYSIPKAIKKESKDVIKKTIVSPKKIVAEQNSIKSSDNMSNTTKETIDAPSIEEFLNFAKTLEIYSEELDFAIKAKYEQWIDNGWKNGYGRKIINWKTSLKSSMPYLIQNNKNIFNIPNIKRNSYSENLNRPKPTYDE